MDGGDPGGYITVGDAIYDEETDIAALLVNNATSIETFVLMYGDPAKDGHTFAGYFLDPEFKKAVPEGGKFDTSMSIYLKYEED